MLATENPYTAPPESSQADAPTKQIGLELKQVSFGNAFFRWTIVCAIAAAPSFCLGYSICKHPLRVPAMVAGVLLFAIAYAFIDTRPTWRNWMATSPDRQCILAVYGLRVLASIAYPVALMNDMVVGLCSTQLVGLFIGLADKHGLDDAIDNVPQIVMTTLVQGVLLNLEIFVAVLCLVSSVHVYRAFRWNWSQSKTLNKSPLSDQNKFG